MPAAPLLALLTLATPLDPPCAVTTDSLIAKVARNYPGITRELQTDDARREWRAVQAAARRRARTATAETCLDILRHVTDWWRDAHLFVWQSPRADARTADARTAAAPRERGPRRAIDLATWRTRWAGGEGVDPVEGVWYGDGLEVAVVPATDGDGFDAVVLTADTTGWEPGMVRARLRRAAMGDGYVVRLASRQFRPLVLDAHVVRGTLLRMPPLLWGRREPAGDPVSAPAFPDPRAPTLRWLDAGTAVLTMPSFDGRYRAPLDALLRAERDALARSARLILDLRGNEGGGTGTALPLAPWIAALAPADERPSRIAEWRPWMLATPENEHVVARLTPAGRDTAPWVRALLQRLRAAAPGDAVRYVDDAALPPRWRPPVVHAAPAQVAILVDRHVVSAAEAFVLEALRSPRVTLFGEPTAGVLDYGTTAIVPLHADETRWFLGYPTVIANDSVPVRGIRGRGITPDVRVDPRAPDVLGQVRQRMP